MNVLEWGFTWTFDIGHKGPFGGRMGMDWSGSWVPDDGIIVSPEDLIWPETAYVSSQNAPHCFGSGAHVPYEADGAWEVRWRIDVDGCVGNGSWYELFINDEPILSGLGNRFYYDRSGSLVGTTHYVTRFSVQQPYLLEQISPYYLTYTTSATMSDVWMSGWENGFDLLVWDPNVVDWYGVSSSHHFTIWRPVALLSRAPGFDTLTPGSDLRDYRPGAKVVKRPWHHAAGTYADCIEPSESGNPEDMFVRRGQSDEWERNRQTYLNFGAQNLQSLNRLHDRAWGRALYSPNDPTFGREALCFNYCVADGRSEWSLIANDVRTAPEEEDVTCVDPATWDPGDNDCLPSVSSFTVALPDSRWAVGAFVPNGYKEWVSTTKIGDVWALDFEQAIPGGMGNLTAPQMWQSRRTREQAVVGYHGAEKAFYVLHRGARGAEWTGPYLNIASATAYAPYILEWPDGTWEAGWYTPDGWVRYTADHPTKAWSLV